GKPRFSSVMPLHLLVSWRDRRDAARAIASSCFAVLHEPPWATSFLQRTSASCFCSAKRALAVPIAPWQVPSLPDSALASCGDVAMVRSIVEGQRGKRRAAHESLQSVVARDPARRGYKNRTSSVKCGQRVAQRNVERPPWHPPGSRE